MAKRFGKFIIKKDKKGFNRYYDKTGKRVSSKEFEDYQKRFLDKARKAGKKAQKLILRFPPKDPSKIDTDKGGRALPKFMQRHLRFMLKKDGRTPKQYQRYLNTLTDEDFAELFKFVEKHGDFSHKSEVDSDRLLQMIQPLFEAGHQLFYHRKRVTPVTLKARVQDRKKELENLLDAIDSDITTYFHMIPVSYPEGKLYVNTGDYLATSEGKFDGNGFKPYISTK